jgi:hypothetical protein
MLILPGVALAEVAMRHLLYRDLIAATEPTVPDIGHSSELFYFRSGSPSDLVFRGGYNG